MMGPRTVPLIVALTTLLFACSGDEDAAQTPPARSSPATGTEATGTVDSSATFALASDAFNADGSFPARFTCDGDDVSPALSWEGVPENTASFALIMDDPDAPGGTFTHWVMYNMGSGARGLPEGVEKTERPENGAIGFQGRNDFGDIGYGGPCPPAGDAHSYDFTFYAIDATVNLGPGASKEELLAAMEGRLLAVTTLTGTYKRAER